MRILVVGTGVIGTTYGWQLSLAGHEVTHWVRDPEKRARFEAGGLPIRCVDMRPRRAREVETVYRPPLVGEPSGHSADVVLVSVNSHQLAGLLPTLEEIARDTTLLFLQNLRLGEDELIAAHLPPDRYVLGFPFKAGGGSTERGIDTVIFGGPLSHTMLGRADGRRTRELRAIAGAIGDARMRPWICRETVAYVRTHYVWAAASVGAFLAAGSFERFLSPEIQRKAYLAMREGWEVCRAQGVDPRSVTPTRYFYWPLWLLVPFTRKMYANEGMKRMFEGHVRHAPEEVRTMFDDVERLGDALGLAMPTYRSFRPAVDAYFARLAEGDASTQLAP